MNLNTALASPTLAEYNTLYVYKYYYQQYCKNFILIKLTRS